MRCENVALSIMARMAQIDLVPVFKEDAKIQVAYRELNASGVLIGHI